MKHLALSIAAATAFGSVYAQQVDTAKPLTLSLGTVKERTEIAAVRALVKYANDHEQDEALSGADKSSFYLVRRKIEFDVTDKGTLGGVALRYGATRFTPTVEDAMEGDVVVSKSTRWIHTVPMTLGLDADRSFKNRDVLLEAGYVPFRGSSDESCFKLGGNPIIGVLGQLGHRVREDPEPGFKSSLRRVKIEAKSKIDIGRCFGLNPASSKSGSLLSAFGADLAKWQVMLEATATRDFNDRKTYRHAALTIRVPMAKDTFFDFKRETGETAPDFDKASQFGLYLTVQY